MTNREFLIKCFNEASDKQIFSILSHDIEKLEEVCGEKLPCWGNENQFVTWMNSNYSENLNNNFTFISVPANIKALAGFDIGEDYYNIYLKDKLDFTKPFGIFFSSNVKTFSLSFIDGLLHKVKNQIGLTDLYKNFRGSENIKNRIDLVETDRKQYSTMLSSLILSIIIACVFGIIGAFLFFLITSLVNTSSINTFLIMGIFIFFYCWLQIYLVMKRKRN